MTTIQKGQRVSLLCSSFLSNGDCLDEDTNSPIRMIAGLAGKENEFSKAVSKSLVGMAVNETKHLRVPPQFAFGEKDDRKVYKLPLTDISSNYQVGDEIKIKVTDNDQVHVFEGIIVTLQGDYAHVDTNHPLAGETLTVKIQVISFD